MSKIDGLTKFFVNNKALLSWFLRRSFRQYCSPFACQRLADRNFSADNLVLFFFFKCLSDKLTYHFKIRSSLFKQIFKFVNFTVATETSGVMTVPRCQVNNNSQNGGCDLETWNIGLHGQSQQRLKLAARLVCGLRLLIKIIDFKLINVYLERSLHQTRNETRAKRF